MARLALLSRTLIVALGQTGTKLVELVVVLILVRIISDEQWSRLAFLLTVYSAAIGIGGLNIQQGLYYFYGRYDPSDRRRLALQTSGLLASSGAVAAAIVASLDLFFRDNSLYVAGAFPAIALVVLLELPTMTIPQLLIALERPTAASVFNVVASVLQTSCFLLPLLLGAPIVSVFHWLIGYAVLRLVFLFFVVFVMLPPGRLALIGASIREQIIYTLPLGLSITASILNRNIDKWFVAAFDTSHFGVYVLAAQEVPFVSILPYSVGAVVATRIVLAFKHGEIQRAADYWKASITRMSLVVVPLTVALVLCAPQLIDVLYTEDYLAAILPFQIYTVILLHRVVEYGVMLRAAGDTRSLWWASLTVLGSNVVLSLPLTWWLGMVGAALGTLLANAIAWVYILTRIARALETDLRGVFPWRRYGAVLAVSILVASIVALAAPYAPAGTWWQLGFRAGFFVALYLALLLLLGFHRRLHPIPEDDARTIEELNA